jgi:glutaredoxin-like protein
MFFGSKQGCAYCDDTRQLAQEVVALSDKLSLGLFDLMEDSELAKKYHVDKVPSIVIAGMDGEEIHDYRIRLAGIPSGYEFTSLVQDIKLVSARESGLSSNSREFINGLTSPVQLQVFVTPTCTYCPQAVVLASRMAMENPLIQTEIIEATEFPELAQKHDVSGVPQTTINDGAYRVVGAVPEEDLIAAIRIAIE